MNHEYFVADSFTASWQSAKQWEPVRKCCFSGGFGGYLATPGMFQKTWWDSEISHLNLGGVTWPWRLLTEKSREPGVTLSDFGERSSRSSRIGALELWSLQKTLTSSEGSELSRRCHRILEWLIWDSEATLKSLEDVGSFWSIKLDSGVYWSRRSFMLESEWILILPYRFQDFRRPPTSSESLSQSKFTCFLLIFGQNFTSSSQDKTHKFRFRCFLAINPIWNGHW